MVFFLGYLLPEQNYLIKIISLVANKNTFFKVEMFEADNGFFSFCLNVLGY